MPWKLALSTLAALLVAAVPVIASDASTTQPAHDRDPVFSPGGQAIAFIRWLGDGTGRVMLVHRDGRGLRAVTPAQPQPTGITWSPDGKSLAYTSGGDIWRVDLATGTPVNLTNDPTHESWQPDWSPAGTWIAYDRFEQCFRCTTVYLVSPDGTQTRKLDAGNQIARRPKFSPNGEELALTFSPNTVIGLDNTVIAKSNGLSYASWSPDGTSLLFANGGLGIYDVRTPRSRPVSRAIKAYPMWSRSGRWIAGTGSRGALAIVTPTGKAVATIKTAATLNNGPSWGADDRVAFVHQGLCGIDVAHGDGTHVHRLTRTC